MLNNKQSVIVPSTGCVTRYSLVWLVCQQLRHLVLMLRFALLQSKKAKKRYRKRMSEVKRTTRPSASSELAVYSKDDLATLAPERMEETINKHRVLMEAIMTEVPQPPSAKEGERAEGWATLALAAPQHAYHLLLCCIVHQS